MKLTAAALTVILAQATSIVAHGGVTSWTAESTTYQGWQPYLSATGQDTVGRPYPSYDPILDAVDPTIHCNNNGANGPIPESITIAAGQPITAHWYGKFEKYIVTITQIHIGRNGLMLRVR
ncbi:hypothetical protein QCA50_010118 [Cerrena zonata]|uniref:Uncharacterized protein n=1 Tax=Cerrena zonata TaxID=2478898 RepID=A0AAW0FZ84_9APHY